MQRKLFYNVVRLCDALHDPNFCSWSAWVSPKTGLRAGRGAPSERRTTLQRMDALRALCQNVMADLRCAIKKTTMKEKIYSSEVPFLVSEDLY